MMKKEVIICGGGVPGLCLAILLGRSGLDVVVYEPHTPPKPEDIKPSGRTVALWQGSLNVLRAVGFDESVFENFSSKLSTMKLVDDNAVGQKAPVEVCFDAKDLGLDCFGYNIPAGLMLAHVAMMAAQCENVEIINGVSIQSYESHPGNVTASTSDGGQVQARIIIGADGRKSIVRKTAGIEVWSSSYGQDAMTFLIDHAQDHHCTSTEFHRPGGPFTIVPLPGQRSSVVWVEKHDDAERFMAMSKQDFTQAVQDRSRGIVGDITLACTPQSWPLMGLRAKALTAPRSALIAEAAHVISPIGAQGMNLSLRDVAILAEVLIDQSRIGMDIGHASVLDLYAKRRQGDVHSRVAMIDGFNRIVSNDLVSLRGLRRVGLKTIEAIPALKDYVMRTGLAPHHDDGRILAGRPL